MSYYSTNQKLDGRFRRIRVEVKRPGADVRARPGYLAPTEAEARAAGAAIDARAHERAAADRDARARGAGAGARQPAGARASGRRRNSIRAIVELDAATAKQPEWMSGGTLRLTIEPERPRAGRRIANRRPSPSIPASAASSSTAPSVRWRRGAIRFEPS